VTDGQLAGVERTTRAGGAEELAISLKNVQPPHGDALRAGTGGYTPDELVELRNPPGSAAEPSAERVR